MNETIINKILNDEELTNEEHDIVWDFVTDANPYWYQEWEAGGKDLLELAWEMVGGREG